MSNQENTSTAPQHDEFTRASQADRVSLFTEFWDFLKYNKKWWMLPILCAVSIIVAVLALAFVGGGSVAPFIYTLF